MPSQLRLNAERAVAILAALAGLGLVATLPGAASGYWRGVSAADWATTYGRIVQRTEVWLPSFKCFVRDARYSLIEYRYVGLDGKWNFGSAQAPQASDLYPGASIEVKFNSKNPSQSLPVVSIAGYRAAHGGTLLIALPLALGFFYTARRLWRASEVNGRVLITARRSSS